MIHSESIVKLSEALCKAQAEMENPAFDCVNPHYKSKYASLAAIRNATIPIFNKYGISVIQHLTSTEKGVKCGVILLHSSGEILELEPLEVPSTKQDAQGLLSAGTYAQRRTLQGASGVVGDEDDDANVASKTVGPKPANPVASTPSATVENQVSAPPAPPKEGEKTLDEMRREMDELSHIAVDQERYHQPGDAIQEWCSDEKFKSKCRSVEGLKKDWSVKKAYAKCIAEMNSPIDDVPL